MKGEGTIAEVLAGAARWSITEGDSALVLPSIPDASIHAIVADPPAGIAFMGKAWDTDKGGKAHWIAWLAGILAEAFRVLKPGGYMLLWALPRTSHWTAEAGERAGFEIRDVIVHLFGSGFPKSLDVSKTIDKAGGRSPADEGDALRARREEAGLTREQLAEAVGCSVRSIENWEDGRPRKARGAVERIVPGPEFRDKLTEVLGYPPDERTVVGPGTAKRGDGTVLGLGHTGKTYGDPNTDDAKRWSGFGTALKPAGEHWILFRKPLSGTIAANVLAHGTGALNIDAARVGTGDSYNRAPASSGYSGIAGYEKGTGRMPESSSLGRFPANLVLSHTAWEETLCPCGAHLSFVARFCPECGSDAVTHRRAGCCAVGERRVLTGTTYEPIGDREGRSAPLSPVKSLGRTVGYADLDGLETVTAWECLATCDCGRSRLAASGGAPPRCACGRPMRWACPVARLDEQSGETVSNDGGASTGIGYGSGAAAVRPIAEGDSGGASRFFNTFAPPDDVEPFFYCAKPSAAEAEAGCERLPAKTAAENVDREEGSAGMQSPRAGAGRTSGRRNHHPTKKSIALMRHFVRLVCPPGGIVLDMFAGSGTTIASAALEGFRAIGIEMGAEYVPIARARATFWAALAGTQAAAEGTPKPKRDAGDERQRTIFDLLSGDP